MTQRIINTGVADKGNGDPLRTAFTKVNDNFTELYNKIAAVTEVGTTPPTAPSEGDLWWDETGGRLYVYYGTSWVDASPVDGAGISSTNELVNGAHTVTLESTGVLTLPDGLTINNSAIGYSTSDTITEETINGTISQTTSYQNQIIVDTTDAIRIANIITQTVDDGVVTTTDSTGSTIDVDGTGVIIKKYVEPDGPNNGSYFQISTSNSGSIIEGVEEDLAGNTYGRVTATQGVVAVNTAAGGIDKEWVFTSDGELLVPEASYIIGTNDLTIKSQVAGNNSGLYLNGNTLLGTAMLYAHNNAIIRADYDGNVKDWNFDTSGTLTTPSLLPRSFTATVDAAHYAGEGSLTLEGDAWYFAVEFSINASGSVETIITNNTPWPSNPGYINNLPFAFTEADHGIPGYTFTLTLVDIQNPGPMMYTTNLTASIAPTLPSTIASPETIKLTADATSWTFSPNGEFNTPGNINVAGGVFLPDNNRLVTTGNALALVADTGKTVEIVSDGANYIWSFGTDGKITVPGTIQNSASTLSDLILTAQGTGLAGNALIRTLNGDYEWTFGNDGNLTLPGNINIGDLTIQEGAPALTVATGNNLAIGTGRYDLVSADAFIGDGEDFVADIEFTDDIISVQVGWILVGPDLPVSAVDASVGNQYRITVPGATFVTGTRYSFRNSTPTPHTWVFGNDGVLTTPGSSTISHQDNDLKLAVTGLTDVVVFRTAGGDVVVNADASLTVDGGVNTTHINNLNFLNLDNSPIQVGQGGGGKFAVAMDRFQVVANPPTTSKGSDGDVIGCVAFDADYIYYCSGLYDGTTDIWHRVQWTSNSW